MDEKRKVKKETISHIKFPSHTSFLFHSIIKNSQIASIFIMDENGVILEINPGVHKFFGYNIEDVRGENFSILFTKEDQKAKLPQKELSTVIKTGSASDNNYVVHKDGQRLWVHGESILGRDESGKIYIIKVIYDLHIQHALEKKLIQLNNDLNNFVYTASHDLKAPINNIEGLLGTLESILKSKEDPKEIISMMQESITKFKSLLKDLSVTGKKQEDSQKEASLIQFEEMTNEVIYNLQDSIDSSKAQIHCDFSLAAEIAFSRKNLRSIIHNLLSNAVKFHDPKRTPEIRVSTEKKDSYILLTVKDNGIGISKENLKKLFTIYERFNNDIEGSGVGLTIVKRILDNNEGKIEVESKLGGGSTFRVYFKIPHLEQ